MRNQTIKIRSHIQAMSYVNEKRCFDTYNFDIFVTRMLQKIKLGEIQIKHTMSDVISIF